MEKSTRIQPVWQSLYIYVDKLKYHAVLFNLDFTEIYKIDINIKKESVPFRVITYQPIVKWFSVCTLWDNQAYGCCEDILKCLSWTLLKAFFFFQHKKKNFFEDHLGFRITTIFSRSSSKDYIISVSAKKLNCERDIDFKIIFLLIFVLWWQPSWIADSQKKCNFVRNYCMNIYVQFGSNQVGSF